MQLDINRYDFKEFKDDLSGFDILLKDLNITNDNITTRDDLINDDEIEDIDDIDRVEIDTTTEIITIHN
tara:strand:- start:240 stop:446 length:207 start_codon:yes stop_codon:yes gene_type:complete